MHMGNTKGDAQTADAVQTEALSVSDQILQCFLDALSEKPGFEEIAARLRKAAIDEKKTSEVVLRRALFGEDEE